MTKTNQVWIFMPSLFVEFASVCSFGHFLEQFPGLSFLTNQTDRLTNRAFDLAFIHGWRRRRGPGAKPKPCTNMSCLLRSKSNKFDKSWIMNIPEEGERKKSVGSGQIAWSRNDGFCSVVGHGCRSGEDEQTRHVSYISCPLPVIHDQLEVFKSLI